MIDYITYEKNRRSKKSPEDWITPMADEFTPDFKEFLSEYKHHMTKMLDNIEECYQSMCNMRQEIAVAVHHAQTADPELDVNEFVKCIMVKLATDAGMDFDDEDELEDLESRIAFVMTGV